MDNASVGIVDKQELWRIQIGYAFLFAKKGEMNRHPFVRLQSVDIFILILHNERIVFMKKTHMLTEIAVAVALSVVCSFIKVWEMPQGGSVALTMVPILLIAFRRGAVAGMITGSVYGLISMALAGVIYHPLSILLDYVLAFGLLGIAGFFKKNLPSVISGCVIGVAGRFLSSLISGAVLFAEYAPAGQNPWIYSLIYQATYMIPELIISTVVIILLYTKARKFFLV